MKECVKLCVGERPVELFVCVATSDVIPTPFPPILSPFLSTLTVINDPQLSGTLLTVLHLSSFSPHSTSSSTFTSSLYSFGTSWEDTWKNVKDEQNRTTLTRAYSARALGHYDWPESTFCHWPNIERNTAQWKPSHMSRSRNISAALWVWRRIHLHWYMCVCLHVSVSPKCAMQRRLKEARRRLSGITLSSLLCPPSPSHSLPDDGWQRMRNFLSWTADWSRLPSQEQPSAFHCRGQWGPLGLDLGSGLA